MLSMPPYPSVMLRRYSSSVLTTAVPSKRTAAIVTTHAECEAWPSSARCTSVTPTVLGQPPGTAGCHVPTHATPARSDTGAVGTPLGTR